MRMWSKDAIRPLTPQVSSGVQVGHVLWGIGLFVGILTATISGLWSFSNKNESSLTEIRKDIATIDTRLARMETLLQLQSTFTHSSTNQDILIQKAVATSEFIN